MSGLMGETTDESRGIEIGFFWVTKQIGLVTRIVKDFTAYASFLQSRLHFA